MVGHRDWYLSHQTGEGRVLGSPPQDMVLLGVEPKGAAASAAARNHARSIAGGDGVASGGDEVINATIDVPGANWLERTAVSMPLVVLKAYLQRLSQVCSA